MKAIRFLKTAEKLKEETPEADSRTSISRSYYAIIHLVKEMLEQEKININREQTHLLHNIFFECNNSKVKAIGNHMSSLQIARVKADYKLSEKVEKRHAKINYKIACKAENDIASAFNSPEKEDIVEKARIYLGAGSN